jgi:hypothetical protein
MYDDCVGRGGSIAFYEIFLVYDNLFFNFNFMVFDLYGVIAKCSRDTRTHGASNFQDKNQFLVSLKKKIFETKEYL